MRRRHVLAVASVAFVGIGIACVDLFHGTEFETLCTHSPNDPRCHGDASIPDAVAEVAVDARRPHPDFCSWSSEMARAQARRACAWLGACEGPLGESAFGPCAVRAQLAYDCKANPSLRPAGDSDAFWACLATVTTCADVDQCAFPSGLQQCGAVEAGSLTRCATVGGNVATRLRCTTSPEAGRAAGVEPCAMLGETCSNEPGSGGSAASCTGTQAFSCSTTVCAGSSAIDCNPAGAGTVDLGLDCANFGGGRCLPSDGGGPACVGGAGARACPTDALPSCVVNVTTGANSGVVSSCVDGHLIDVDCTKLGLPCDVSPNPPLPFPTYDPAAACVRRAPAADVCDTGDACLGSTIRSCGRGALQTVDCLSVGLKGCAINPANGKAACTPP